MTIEILCEQSSNRKRYSTVVERLIAAAFQKLEVIASDVKKVVVADEASYGFAISEHVADGSTYTDDEWCCGQGRTIPDMSSGIFDGSIVVLRSSVIDSFLPPRSEQEGIENLVRHIFFHEVGHCIDNRRREHQHYLRPTGQGFHDNLNGCLRAIVCEYAACFFSAKCMSEEAFVSFIDEDVLATVQDQHRRREKIRARFDAGEASILDLRNEVWASIWLELRKMSELFAYQRGGNLDVTRSSCRAAQFFSPARLAILDNLRKDLGKEWSAYPGCCSGFEEVLIWAFVDLGRVDGYSFDPNLENDSFELCKL